MDIVHRLHYLVLSQKSDLMTMEREQRLRVRRQSSLPAYPRGASGRIYNPDKELFAAKAEASGGGGGGGGGGGVAALTADRKLSATSTGSMKNKWLKAFRSLKPPSAPPPAQAAAAHDKRNGAAREAARLGGDPDAHNFQEYTYKKITPCDVCSQVLRGHTKQGLRCRLCKMNVHVDCIAQVGKCQTKSRLLRRQKSTSEIESRIQETAFEEEKEAEVDQIYQVLKRANEISKPGAAAAPAPGVGGEGKPLVRVSAPEEAATRTVLPRPTTGLAVSAQPVASSSGWMRNSSSAYMLRQPDRTSPLPWPGTKSTFGITPHSPRRQKLNLRMKSLSLDSPECSDQRRRPLPRENVASAQSSSSRIHSPSSPVHTRRLLSARVGRMSSVELPDDHDRSLTSPSASPCASPIKQLGKGGRLLPANLYVILYNFKSRHQDELDLKAGYKVTVIDTSDPNWWKGKCFGKVGFFPSKYCTKLQAGEKPLQVTHNLQVTDGDNGLMLLRDQIVIQVGDEVDGMVMIRAGDNRQGVCPLKFLQEV